MTTQTTNEQAAWEAFQMRTAIILGLEIFHKRTELQKRVAARGDRAPEPREANGCLFECASFAKAALQRMKSLRGTDRAITALAARLEAFIAAETAAGRCVRLGYWNERGNWTVLAPADFLRELVAAYRRRSTSRGN